MSKFNGTVKAKQRREKVILRLEQQLVRGVKTLKQQGVTAILTTPLEAEDITRIKKELVTLKARV